MNDFLSSTRTFELKSKVAALIKQYDYPMVLNVVLHRLNIDHVGEILAMAERMRRRVRGAREHAVLRLGVAQPRRSCCRAARRSSARRRRRGAFRDARRQQDASVLRRPGLFRGSAEGLHERLGLDLSDHHAGRHGACRATRRACCRDSSSRTSATADVERIWCDSPGVQPLSRRRVDEGAVPQLPGEGPRLRRLPLPGVPADRRRRERRSRLRPIPASRARHGRGRGRGRGGGAEPLGIPHAAQFIHNATMSEQFPIHSR